MELLVGKLCVVQTSLKCESAEVSVMDARTYAHQENNDGPLSSKPKKYRKKNPLNKRS